MLAESIKRYKKFRRNQLMFQQDQQQLPALKKMSSLDQGRCSVQTLLAGQVVVVNLKEWNMDVADGHGFISKLPPCLMKRRDS